MLKSSPESPREPSNRPSPLMLMGVCLIILGGAAWGVTGQAKVEEVAAALGLCLLLVGGYLSGRED